MAVLWEQVEGTRWAVVHDTETAGDAVAFALAPAPPPYSSPELARAMTGALEAFIDAHCGRCEAVALPPAALRRDGGAAVLRWTVPHASWCPYGNEAVDALHEACRPPGGVPELSDAELETEADRVGDYLHDLRASLLGAGGQGGR